MKCFCFLTVLQFYTTFRDILILVVVFTDFLKTKQTKLRCKVILASKVYFYICDSISERQDEVSNKIVVVNILWLKSTFLRIGNSSWVFYFSSNMQKLVPRSSIFCLFFFSERNTQYYFIVTVWLICLWAVIISVHHEQVFPLF